MKVTRPGDSTGNDWRYVQPETAAVFTAFSFYGLLEAVEKHRKAMKLDLSEGWMDRFQDDLCRQNERVPCDRGKKQPTGKKSLTVADLKRFMNTLSAQKGDFVSQEEADRRAKVWLDLGTIDNTGLEYPEHCWQRQVPERE